MTALVNKQRGNNGNGANLPQLCVRGNEGFFLYPTSGSAAFIPRQVDALVQTLMFFVSIIQIWLRFLPIWTETVENFSCGNKVRQFLFVWDPCSCICFTWIPKCHWKQLLAKLNYFFIKESALLAMISINFRMVLALHDDVLCQRITNHWIVRLLEK